MIRPEGPESIALGPFRFRAVIYTDGFELSLTSRPPLNVTPTSR